MKTINSQKTSGQTQTGGFTLIEMIGVLAVIAILAALLLPKVANAINDAKINSTVGTYQSIQAATTSHYGKYLAFNALFGTNVQTAPIVGYDTAFLLPENFIDKPFSSKVGLGATVELVTGTNSNSGAGYNFTGSSTTNNATTSTFQYVVECVITNVAAADANAISLLVDGPSMTPAVGATDTAGKVTWTAGVGGVGNLYLYVDGR
jgi:prepilin-type N-terminal cleavage/methylation domain-containing protein